MGEPNWSKVLDVLYREGEAPKKPINRITRHHLLCERTDLEPGQIEQSLIYLDDNGLISLNSVDHQETRFGELENPRSEKIILKAEGFEVAHERELSKRQEGASTATAYLTAVLAVTAVVQATAAASSASGPNSLLLDIMAGGAGIVLFASWWQLYQIGLLDIERFE